MGCRLSKKTKIPQKNKIKQITINDFNIKKKIGVGKFGSVYLVEKKDIKKEFAMKILNKKKLIQESQVNHANLENKILSNLNHPFVVKLECSFQTNNDLFLIMQYISGGELYHQMNFIDFFSEDQIRLISAEIILALEYIHSKGIIYRDLKPENVLLDNSGHIYLIDFGFAKEKNSKSNTFCGTIEYMAPEMLLGKEQGFQIDFWSLGCLIYELIHKTPPFYSDNQDNIFKKILKGKFSFSSPASNELKSLIENLLIIDPDKRLSFSENYQKNIKNHPFFEGLDWNKVYHKKYQSQIKPFNEENDLDIDISFPNQIFKDEKNLQNDLQNDFLLFPEFSYSINDNNFQNSLSN
ncbi:non-specific serine/threonine protein kinase [Anaeramoeba ignava]|uniref:Non-specific serine/threonine protein kinase n=1 Tax=Anaeramoeba ignava TaxID=1746090 RepID=A0A9Q0L7F0_ANAIG|nr:non-specific serine/threonine protein kinase [Anaeramoeba ignava]